MPAILLIGIPIAVAVLFWGIMTLPDEEILPKLDGEKDAKPEPTIKKIVRAVSKKKKKK